MSNIPPWLIVHVPHDSTHIPPELRSQFVLDDAALAAELIRMTDHHTLELFAQGVPAAQVVRASVSRLVVDVERFEDDALEPMAARGMGVVYTQTHDSRPLRHPLSAVQREQLLADWYRPHHAALYAATQAALATHGRALVLDAHSFPSRPLPYEPVQDLRRPEICIGTDAFHTPAALREAFCSAFAEAGFEVALDTPFAGALVPLPESTRNS